MNPYLEAALIIGAVPVITILLIGWTRLIATSIKNRWIAIPLGIAPVIILISFAILYRIQT